MKLYNKINRIKNNVLNNVVIVTHSTLSILDNEIEFEYQDIITKVLHQELLKKMISFNEINIK